MHVCRTELMELDIEELEPLYLDAMRYRWMRKNISDDMQWYLLDKHGMGAEGLDEAIDAAMLKTPNVELRGCRAFRQSRSN